MMQEILTILRRREGNAFDDYVAFRAPPAEYFGCSCSEMSGLAQSIGWHVEKRRMSSNEYSYQLLFPSDIFDVVIPKKVGTRDATFHLFTEREKSSFMQMFDAQREYFIKHVATA